MAKPLALVVEFIGATEYVPVAPVVPIAHKSTPATAVLVHVEGTEKSFDQTIACVKGLVLTTPKVVCFES